MTEAFDPTDEPRDWTKVLWIGIGILLIGMVTALWMSGRVQSNRTLVQAKHILISFNPGDAAERIRALETVTSVREQIVANPNSFERLAKEYSDDPGSGARGGYLGATERGSFVEKFEEFAWTAPIGELSDIILTQHGFHLVVVVDRTYSELDLYNEELDKRIRSGETPGIPQ
jgi:peptidyl-prolyl cis-trans isomerase SurA